MLRQPGGGGRSAHVEFDAVSPFTDLFQEDLRSRLTKSVHQSQENHNEWFRHRYGYGVSKTGA